MTEERRKKRQGMSTLVVRIPEARLALAHAKANELGISLADLTRKLLDLACDTRHSAGERIGSYAEVGGIIVLNRHPSL